MTKQPAIIIDLDGTLCNIEHRLKFLDRKTYGKDYYKMFWDELPKDSVNLWCKSIIEAYTSKDPKIVVIFLTGRHIDVQEKTTTWLRDNLTLNFFHTLFMRPDHSWDVIEYKRKVFVEQIKQNYDVIFAIDDDIDVIKMWSSLGVSYLYCGEV